MISGGETAEMPALFGIDSYDLAGYCIGVVDYGRELPSKHIEEGDILLGLPSNGFHFEKLFSNRQIIRFNDKLLRAPFLVFFRFFEMSYQIDLITPQNSTNR